MTLRTTHAFILAVAASFAGACTQESPDRALAAVPAAAPAVAPAAAPTVTGWTQVDDRSLVCMVNDTYMGKAQIPVEVEGKTYFGCCAMCKERLAKEPQTRVAQDPVTGESVDKSTAVIAQDANGAVKYFASAETLRTYRARL